MQTSQTTGRGTLNKDEHRPVAQYFSLAVLLITTLCSSCPPISSYPQWPHQLQISATRWPGSAAPQGASSRSPTGPANTPTGPYTALQLWASLYQSHPAPPACPKESAPRWTSQHGWSTRWRPQLGRPCSPGRAHLDSPPDHHEVPRWVIPAR